MHDREEASVIAPIDDLALRPSWKSYVAVALSMVLTLIYLAPTLRAGLSEGDVALAQIRGFGGFEGLPPFATLARVGTQLAMEQGGWFPLASFTLPFWWLGLAPAAARALQVCAVTIDLGLFVLLVARLSDSLRLALLAAIGTLLALQLRKPHDAILGETLRLPVVLGLVLVALLAYLNYLRTGRRSWLGCAFVLEFAACCIHEVAYPLALLFPIVDFCIGRSRRVGAVFLFVPALLLAVALFAHREIPASAMWLTHPDAGHVVRMLQQILAAVPTSYRAFGNLFREGLSSGDNDNSFAGIPSATLAGSAFCLLATLTAYFILSTDRRRSMGERTRPLTLMALLLWVSPALFEDPRVWIHGMPFGEAGNTVFVECFGFGLLLAVGIRALLAARYRLGIALVPPMAALLILLVSYGNVRANERVIRLDQSAHETWSLTVEAGRAGLFSKLPQNTTIVFDGPAILPITESSGFRNLRYFLYQVSSARFRVSSRRNVMIGGSFCEDQHHVGSLRVCRADSDVFILTRDSTGLVGGGLTLAHWSGTRAGSLRVDRAIAFRGLSSATSQDNLAGLVMAGGRGLVNPRVTAGSNGVLAEVRRGCGSVDLDRAFAPDSPKLDYADGFLGVKSFKPYSLAITSQVPSDTSKTQTWRFGTERATLHVRPDGCPGQILFAGDVFARQPTKLVVTTNDRVLHLSASQAGTHVGLLLTNSRSVPIEVTFITTGPAADDAIGPQFDRRQFPQAHMLLLNPSLSIVPNVPHV